MSIKKTESNFQKIFEEHPIKSCIVCFTIGISVTYTILSLFYENKIQNTIDRYEDKIEFLKKSHEQDLQINEIKLQKEDGVKYILNIEPNSKLANEIDNLRKSDKDEK